MIISKDINPERDFYYLGAKVIEIISKNDDRKIDFLDTFEQVKATEKISVNLFTLTLNWLHIIGAISMSKAGDLIKCF